MCLRPSFTSEPLPSHAARTAAAAPTAAAAAVGPNMLLLPVCRLQQQLPLRCRAPNVAGQHHVAVHRLAAAVLVDEDAGQGFDVAAAGGFDGAAAAVLVPRGGVGAAVGGSVVGR